MADVRVTEQRFDSSGRTVLAASGPALQTEVLSDLLGYTLDADHARREAASATSSLSPGTQV